VDRHDDNEDDDEVDDMGDNATNPSVMDGTVAIGMNTQQIRTCMMIGNNDRDDWDALDRCCS
jgi:hypothetical protein